MGVSGSASPLEQAQGLLAAQNYQAAVEGFEGIVAFEPSNGAAWKGLGMSLIQLGQFDKAAHACERASKLLAGSAECRYAYGYVLGALQRFEEAIVELDATLMLQPNHLAAKQTLVYALTQHGQRTLANNPQHGEALLERAFKLDHANSSTLAPLLEWYRTTNQRGKASKLLQSLPPDLKSHAQIAPIVEAMHADPAFHQVFHQAETTAQAAKTAAVAAPAAKPASINMIPCPQCRLPIADYAAICPHCNFQNRAVGRFATMDSGPDVIWQDVAYNIVCVLWLLRAGWEIFAATQFEVQARDWFLTLGIANAGIGLGLIFKVEWVMFLAKILLWVNVAVGGLGLVMAMSLGRWGDFAIQTAMLALTCFFIYLINYHSD